MRRTLHPVGWPAPAGYAHGVLAAGRFVAVAGQIGLPSHDGAHDEAIEEDRDRAGAVASASTAETFASQFARALAKVVTVVETAGGRAAHLVSLSIFVTDLGAYRAARPLLSKPWKQHFLEEEPAVTLVEVKGLFDEGACVEIAGHAVIPVEGSQ